MIGSEGETLVAAAPADIASGGPRLLYLQERFPVRSETFVLGEVQQLRDWGLEVSVMTTRRPIEMWAPDLPLTEAGTRVGSGALGHLYWLRARPRRYLAFLAVLLRAPLRDKPFVLLAPGIARVARSRGVEHVHSHFAFRCASVARGVAALLGRPRSVTTHANDVFVRSSQLHARVAGAGVLTISRYNQEFLRRLGIESEVNHCGVDLSRVAAPSRSRSTRPTDVVFVGRMVSKKGPLTFLETVRSLHERGGRPLRVRMIGDGPLSSEVAAYIADHDLAVEQLGALGATETLGEIRAAKVLCLPCSQAEDGDLDGIPVVLMEAMATGTAVVSTDVSGIPELIGPDEGWLVSADVDDLPGALAAAVTEALDPAADVIRTRAARARVEQEFTLQDQARGVLEHARRAGEQVA